ncbi:sperm microtubule inner protein 8 [Mixophyes fleayi]|uniref:sperm microtubule inner protein 8 n=1 Tax=Mixophyes fleayi TaxID=3061075 RepID=UPI003F4DD1A5
MMLSQDSSGTRSDGSCGSPVYKLAGVKQTLYHPRLPSLRRMEMDTIGHKLSDHHSRTSTPCTHKNFSNAKMPTYDLPEHRLPSLEVTDIGRQITQRYRRGKVAPIPPGMTQEEWLSFTQAANDWYKYVPYAGELQLQDLQKYVLGYRGRVVSCLSPKVSRSWKYCLQQNLTLDHHGQRPLPVETTNTFRMFGSSYSSNTYMRPWH